MTPDEIKAYRAAIYAHRDTRIQSLNSMTSAVDGALEAIVEAIPDNIDEPTGVAASAALGIVGNFHTMIALMNVALTEISTTLADIANSQNELVLLAKTDFAEAVAAQASTAAQLVKDESAKRSFIGQKL